MGICTSHEVEGGGRLKGSLRGFSVSPCCAAVLIVVFGSGATICCRLVTVGGDWGCGSRPDAGLSEEGCTAQVLARVRAASVPVPSIAV